MIAHRLGNGDAANRSDAFEPRRHIDAITKDVSALDDHISEVHSHAEFNAPILWNTGITSTECALNICRTADRAHHTGELHQHAIAGKFDDAPLMLGDFAVDHIRLHAFQRRERTGFIDAHQPAVADNVGGKNSSQAALHINPVTLPKSAMERNTKMPRR
jgi:hypothetical protein